MARREEAALTPRYEASEREGSRLSMRAQGGRGSEGERAAHSGSAPA